MFWVLSTENGHVYLFPSRHNLMFGLLNRIFQKKKRKKKNMISVVVTCYTILIVPVQLSEVLENCTDYIIL